jgi:nudix-type nucleoside diphosphatase (YffH/AdpP family)
MQTMMIEITSTEMKHAGWARFLVATIRLADGRSIRREIEDHGVAICVLPYDAERRTAVLVRQFRAPVFFAAREPDMLEAIAGIVEDEDPATCARREAREEAGLELGALEHVVTGWTMPGVSTERMHFYLAPYRQDSRVGNEGAVGEDEHVTRVEMTLAELASMADAGRLHDVKTLLLLQTLRLRQPHLFAG